MRFALLGDHPDGLEAARALVQSGRHELASFHAVAPAWVEPLRLFAPAARAFGDVEEILSDPAVEAVIVAAPVADRPALLRRALQSERHVLCVYPPDLSPDAAYEAALIQGDTGHALLPLLPAPHPGIARLAELARAWGTGATGWRLLLVEREAPRDVFLGINAARTRFALPDWAVLRAVGGEIAEVAAFSVREEATADDPLLLSGRFEPGGLFQAALVPDRGEPRWRLTLLGSSRQAELSLPAGLAGPARLTWRDEAGTAHEENWENWNPWPALVEAFEAATGLRPAAGPGGAASWQDVTRTLELDDAARRSLERRRASTLEYPEASEEVGFKGTMTLVGCGLLWGILGLLVLANWFPAAKLAVLPVLALFLVMQLLRWLIPRERPGG